MPPLLCYPNVFDTSVLSGGAWQAGAEASCLQSRFRNDLARTLDLAGAAGRMHIDFGGWYYLDAAALANHNLTLSGQLRLFLWGDAAGTVPLYDSGWQWAWPRWFKSKSLRFRDTNFWGGRASKDVYRNVKPLWTWPLSGPTYAANKIAARSADLWFSDPANPDKYFQAGRFFLGRNLLGSLGMEHGATIKWLNNSPVDRALDGTKWVQKRTPYRQVACEFKWLKEDEGVNNHLMFTQLAGLDGEALYVFDTENPRLTAQRSFICTLSQIDALTWHAFGGTSDDDPYDSGELTSMQYLLEESV